MKYIVSYNERSAAYFEDIEALVDFFWEIGFMIASTKEKGFRIVDVSSELIQKQIAETNYSCIYVNDNVVYRVREV